MAGKKKKGRSSSQSQNMIPSTTPEKQLLKKQRTAQFVVHSITKPDLSGSVYKCDVAGVSFDGRPLTGIKCSNYEEVEGYFKKREKSDYSFVPISAYTHGDEILLLGEHVGERFEKWVANNSGILFTSNGELTNVMMDIGKQFFKIVTTNHQEGVSFGNIQEGMYINDDSNIIIIPNLETTDTEFKVGVKKDLADLCWFMNVLKPYTEKSSELQAAIAMFFNLFPKKLWLLEDEDKLKTVSYIICHNPIFWGYFERYLFGGIADKIFDKFDGHNNPNIRSIIPIHEGLTNVEDWFNKILGLLHNNVLRKIYDHGIKDNPRSYSTRKSIIPFIRNTYEHFHRKDCCATLEDIDSQLIQTFPNVHFKIYLAMASPNLDTKLCLDSPLKEGKLNYYCK